jgi:hypothetical protein
MNTIGKFLLFSMDKPQYILVFLGKFLKQNWPYVRRSESILLIGALVMVAGAGEWLFAAM